MKVHVLQGFKFKNTNKHKNQLVLLDKTKRQLPLLLIRYKISQTVRCSSHSNGFQNMPIIALRRQCKWYLKHFFQMSSNFFVFWQIPTCDHLNETFLGAPSFRDCFCYCCFGISAVVVYCFIGSYTTWRFLVKCTNEFKAKIGILKQWISQELHKASVALWMAFSASSLIFLHWRITSVETHITPI